MFDLYRLRLIHLGNDIEPQPLEAEIEDCALEMIRLKKDTKDFGAEMVKFGGKQQRFGILITIKTNNPYKEAYGKNYKYEDLNIRADQKLIRDKTSCSDLQVANLGYLLGHAFKEGCMAKIAVYNLDLSKIICSLTMRVKITDANFSILAVPIPIELPIQYDHSIQGTAQILEEILRGFPDFDDFLEIK